MSVLNSQNQRGCCFGASCAGSAVGTQNIVHLRTGLEQSKNHLGPSLAHREEEWRKSRRKRRAKVSSCGKQSINHRNVPLGRGPHQGGLFFPLASVDVGSPCEERFDRAEP